MYDYIQTQKFVTPKSQSQITLRDSRSSKTSDLLLFFTNINSYTLCCSEVITYKFNKVEITGVERFHLLGILGKTMRSKEERLVQ